MGFMESISMSESSIRSKDPMNVRIKVNPENKMWVSTFERYPIVRDVLESLEREADGRRVVTRNVIFEEKNTDRKVILVLLWAYPRGIRNRTNLLNAIGSALEIAKKGIGRKMDDEQFNVLSQNPGIRLATLSKLLYFLEYTLDGDRAMILDRNVRTVLSDYPQFEDVARHRAGSYAEYSSYVRTIGEISRQMKDVTPDQLEFFLFERGKEKNAAR